eukprot:403342991
MKLTKPTSTLSLLSTNTQQRNKQSVNVFQYAPENTLYSKNEYQRGSKPMGYLNQELESEVYLNEQKKLQKYNNIMFYSEFKKRKEQIRFQDPQFVASATAHEHLQPGINFYKFLAKKSSHNNQDQNKFSLLKVWIPDTIVYQVGQEPFWIYSGFDGCVYRADKFYERSIVSKLGSKYMLNELSAIVKFEDYTDSGSPNGNQVILQSTKELAIRIANKKNEGENMVIQRFIKCKGGNAFICRAHWRRGKAANCYIITNKKPFKDTEQLEDPLSPTSSSSYSKNDNDRYLTNQVQRFACSIIVSKGNSTYQEPVMMSENIAKYVEQNIGVRFSDLVADFIKDESGIWWFLQVKAFAYEQPTFKLRINAYCGPVDEEHLYLSSESDKEGKNKDEKEEKDLFQKMRICKFCQLGFSLSALTHKLTMQQIINTEKYIKDIGFNKEWLTHGDSSEFIDPFVLYQSFSVCKDCYSLHDQVQKLKIVHKSFGKVFGIQIKEQDTGIPFEKNENINSDKMLDYIIEKHFSQPPAIGSQAKNSKEMMTIPSLYRYKMMVIINELCEISPIPQNYHKEMQLEYSFLNNNYKTKLSINQSFNSNIDFIPLSKMQLFHFFVDEPKKAIMLLDELKKLKIDFKIPSGKLIGSVNLNLNDFKSPLVNQKQFYQLVTFDKFIGYLKCAVCWDTGFEPVDVKALSLTMHDTISGLYIPPNDYCACDGLPEEWISLIPNINQQTQKFKDKLTAFKFDQDRTLSSTSGLKTQFFLGENIKQMLRNSSTAQIKQARRGNIIQIGSTGNHSSREDKTPRKNSAKSKFTKELKVTDFQVKQLQDGEKSNKSGIQIQQNLKIRPMTSRAQNSTDKSVRIKLLRNNVKSDKFLDLLDHHLINMKQNTKPFKLKSSQNNNSNIQTQYNSIAQTQRSNFERPTTVGSITSRLRPTSSVFNLHEDSKFLVDKKEKIEPLKLDLAKIKPKFTKKLSILSEKGLNLFLEQKLKHQQTQREVDTKVL